MSKRTNKSIFSVITALVVIAVIVVGGLFVYKFTNGFNESLKTFYVIVNDKEIMAKDSGYVMGENNGLTVSVKYVFGAPSNSEKLYSVAVISNYDKENNFDFTVDGRPYSFAPAEDYTAGFDIDYGEDTFTIKPKGYLTEVIRAVYPDKEVSDCSNKEYPDMFILTVYSYNEESSVSIYFTLRHDITSVSLDKSEVII